MFSTFIPATDCHMLIPWKRTKRYVQVTSVDGLQRHLTRILKDVRSSECMNKI